MSIIDTPYKTEAELLKALELAAPMIDEALARRNFAPAQKQLIALMRAGFSYADIFAISEEDRNAMLSVGVRLLKVGDTKRARDVLYTLFQMEPSDGRVLYALAGCYQAQGNVATAAKLYIFFLAGDATNPHGYARLGECFMVAREYQNARDAFKYSAIEAERANAPRRVIDYARKMMAEAEGRLAEEFASNPV
ncbi:MAG: tetratricopeptide repeat protein [Methylocystis sp.]|uniref:tetratricopeptide repeat protein n=1 Tax=Methylocystis sp. TaxID=1911079 RepID=UPI003DA54778